MSPTDVLAITKHIPFGLSLEQAYKTNANFRAYVENKTIMEIFIQRNFWNC